MHESPSDSLGESGCMGALVVGMLEVVALATLSEGVALVLCPKEAS